MISNITTQCWILALFVRDDGERLLLGDGVYDFKERQQHFKANLIVNDAVDVQGNDGTLLAGQVRRATTQSFDGYVGDATSTPQEIEQYRRDFFAFFLKNHFYEVIYIFQDGTAIKRQKGFLVDAPEIKELFQISPEYHVALNFEDVNYYEYNENAEGQEIYGESADIPIISAAKGGQVWDENGLVWEYSIKNLVYTNEKYDGGINFTYDSTTGTTTVSGTPQWTYAVSGENTLEIPAGTYTISIGETLPFAVGVATRDKSTNVRSGHAIAAGNKKLTFTLSSPAKSYDIYITSLTTGVQINTTSFNIQMETGDTATDFQPFTYSGQEWEVGGHGGVVTIDVDSIDIVYPVITIKGPANSPTLENITTNTRLSFSGNVTSSQTLVIDTRSQTAKLNGTSVISSISGDWLVLAPGINRISYTASNDTAPDATIEWSEVVG